MKKHFRTIFLLSLFFWVLNLKTVVAQNDLGSINFAYKYDVNSELLVDYQVSQKADSDSLSLICQLVLNDDEARVTDYHFSIYEVASYNEPLQNRLSIDSLYIGSRGKSHFWDLSFPITDPSKVIVLEIKSDLSQIRYYYDILSSEVSPVNLTDQSEVPLVRSWVRPSELIMPQHTVMVLQYVDDFKPALPPMVTRDPAPAKDLVVDSVFSATPINKFKLVNPGLNFFQKDTSDMTGLALLSVNKYFPKPAKLDQLIAPLIYITTKEEWMRLSNPNIEKKDFDKFWMDMTKSQARAKRIIKTYYDRVEEANQFFTTYKEGWKTDKGMIYIVFGPPDRITKIGDKEIWNYNGTAQNLSLKFSFIRVKSVFSAQHYVLIRERKYANPWFRGVNTLRKVRF